MPGDRDELIRMLQEAAELEHDILCCYLHAAFTLKDERDDLTLEELAAVERWRASLLTIAVEEMQHLAQVANLLVAVGGQAHFTCEASHPGRAALKLAPLEPATLQLFIDLERPKSQARGSEVRGVGEFYLALRKLFLQVEDRIGAAELLCGPLERQLTAQETGMRQLVAVRNADDAMHAIDRIIEQGEGAGDIVAEPSHFRRLERIQGEYVKLAAARADFRPYLVSPPAEDDDPIANAAQETATACYVATSQCIALAIDFAPEQAETRRRMLQAGYRCMQTLGRLSRGLARRPAADGGPKWLAGPTFTFGGEEGVGGPAAIAHLHDRLRALLTRLEAAAPDFEHSREELTAVLALLTAP